MINDFNEQLERCADQKEFLNAVNEIFTSIKPALDRHPEYEAANIPARIITPDRIIVFKVEWKDDLGNIRVNNGYRVQFNNENGPYKGGLRFHPTVNLSILKFLGFEQIFKNRLTGLPLGGGKGGSDFNPKGKSDAEVIRFCHSFMDELYKYIGPSIDVPAGDIGVGGREIRAMYEEYERLTGRKDGALTGKPLDMGGSLGRTEATGYGLCYITERMLEECLNSSFKGKNVVISGSGNVAIYAAEKTTQLGGKVLAMSDSSACVYDPDGIDLAYVKDIKEKRRGRIAEYLDSHHNAKKLESKDIWTIKCDIALPCATQLELDLDSAKELIKNGVIAVGEGANMPCTLDATKEFINNGVLFLPGKASNAGGVAVSGLEMIQNANKQKWAFATVDNKLKGIMGNIFDNISKTAEEYGAKDHFVVGANIYSFLAIADEMMGK